MSQERSALVPVFDGVSPGATEYPRTETLLPIGLRYSHPRRGCLLSRMVAVPSQGGGKSGVETKEVVLNALANAPGGGFTRRRLRASLAAAGGDGAVVSGGTDARHKSTKAADHVFAAVHPSMEEPLAFWDLFHRSMPRDPGNQGMNQGTMQPGNEGTREPGN